MISQICRQWSLRSGSLIALALILTLQSSCFIGDDSNPEDPNRNPDDPAWTVMVYMDADNDLEPFGIDDLHEMMNVGSSENLNIIVLIDRIPGYSDESIPLLGNFSDAHLLKILPGSIEVIENLGEVNMGDPSILSWFIDYVGKNYPAQNYMLDLWNHGHGVDGVAWDDSDGHDKLELQELASALNSGLLSSQIGTLDLIGFDACLMASLEVAQAVEPYARYMLASEELEPGHGWDYTRLAILDNTSPASTIELGKEIINGFVSYAQRDGTSADITLSLIDLNEVSDLIDDLTAFVAEFDDQWGEERAVELAVAGSKAVRFGNKGPMVDLISLINGIRLDGNADAVRSNILATIAKVVVSSHQGPKFPALGGISIYFPGTQKQPSDSELSRYRDIAAGNWDSLLEQLFGAQDNDTTAPSFVQKSDELAVTVDGETLIAECDLDPASLNDLVEVHALFGIVGEDNTSYFLWKAPAYVDEDGHVQASWNPSIPTLSDGTSVAYAMLDISFDPKQSVWYLHIPMHYEAETGSDLEQAIWRTAFSEDDDEILGSSVYVFDDAGVAGQLATVPGSLVYADLLVSSEFGQYEYVAFKPGLDPEAEWTFDLTAIESGTTIIVNIIAIDVGGNVSVIEGGGSI